MRTLGLIVIIVGLLLIILALAGVVGHTSMRPWMLASIIMLVAGWFLYRRKPD